MKNMFNNTDLTVFQVIHKLVEHPEWAKIDAAVIKAYVWLSYRTNTRESVVHDLTDADFAAGVGVNKSYIADLGSKKGIRSKLADAGLVASAKNPRGLGWNYTILDPDTGLVIDPDPFDVRKLSPGEITRYFQHRSADLGMVSGKTQMQCPFCALPSHNLTLDFDPDAGTWLCHACNANGIMVEFERRVGNHTRMGTAAVALARYLNRLEKSAISAPPVTMADPAEIAASGF